MKIVTAEEMRAIDLATNDRATTGEHGIPSLTLMENAGAAVAEFARKHFEFATVCAVCGKGNNGGDGFVAARKLHEAGKKVSVIVLAGGADELRGDAAEMFKRLPVSAHWIAHERDFSKPEIEQALQAGLILDAILGAGFKPPLKGLAEKAVVRINQAAGWVLAVDLPSGIDADAGAPPEAGIVRIHCDGIISFTAAKPALVFGNLTDGPIAIASIGSPDSLIAAHSHLREDVLTSRDVQALSMPRPADAHKGDFGHVLIIGGSVGKSGAAAMAGLAALRAGAGLVTVASPKSVQPLIAAYAPELMTEPLPETAEGSISLLALAERDRLLKGKFVVAIGPGISRNPETAEFVRDLVSKCSTSLVIDADGLNAFEGMIERIKPDADVNPLSVRVLTPHPGEMSRLTGLSTGDIQANRITLALKTAAETQTCVVLKGHRTVIASAQGHAWINTTGNPGMAKGGSGDVLSGIIAGILAQAGRMHGRGALSALESDSAANVAKAVYLHGLAGDIAASLYGQQSMIATDMIHCLGEAFAACEDEALSKLAYLQR